MNLSIGNNSATLKKTIYLYIVPTKKLDYVREKHKG